MLWRILSAVIVLFWAVMTGLIIRDTYFPDHSRFAVVPPRFVFDLFLTEAAAFNNTLHLYQGPKKIGHTTFTIRRDGSEESAPLYGLLASGTVDFPGPGKTVNDVTFRLTGELADAERWESFDLEVQSDAAKMQGTVEWKLGDKLPKVEVKKDEQVVMNTALMETMMAMQGKLGGGLEWLTQLRAMQAGAAASPLTAREGVMDLAGKKRRCYIVTLKVLQTEEVRIYFTEVGELARIELPQDYRFIEPMMHGLERGVDTMH